MNKDNKLMNQRNNQLKRNWPRNIWDSILFPFDEENWEINQFHSELLVSITKLLLI